MTNDTALLVGHDITRRSWHRMSREDFGLVEMGTTTSVPRSTSEARRLRALWALYLGTGVCATAI